MSSVGYTVVVVESDSGTLDSKVIVLDGRLSETVLVEMEEANSGVILVWRERGACDNVEPMLVSEIVSMDIDSAKELDCIDVVGKNSLEVNGWETMVLTDGNVVSTGSFKIDVVIEVETIS
ncbi:hypothetical protein NDU88_010472 [Pleurodeles waltl]|uniref:Uncharacterized protein n=1 Tax=Pleurodeles waltl TaxID=8319 RepID=A0AAV7R0P1_PLEWA|nr:hypothetical protein NDU88_010470 [Pleurodeles waltl]KAJ1144170.1 hypothetical protein NDU88_010472 [Pleurodeles waltl]